MKKLFALTVLLALIASPAMAQKVTALPAATIPLAGPELLSILQPGTTGGTTSQVTAQNIANLGGQTPNQFNVTAYGAKCDGVILYNQVVTTNTSNIISSAVYDFKAADVGKIITIGFPANLDTITNPTNIYTGTITGLHPAGGGVGATLSAPVPFTSTSFRFASARFYLTDDTVAIQAALDANHAAESAGTGGTQTNEQQGGIITFPAGVCVAKNLTIYSGQRWQGATIGGSLLMLPNNANSDLVDTFDYSACTGAAFPGGSLDFSIENLGFDGNKLANTGTNIGLQGTGTGDGLRLCGAAMKLHNVATSMFAADGISVDGWGAAGCPGNTPQCMESYFDHIQGFYNTGNGMIYNNLTDSYVDSGLWAYNTAGGFVEGSSNNSRGGNLHYVSNSHTYANGNYGFLVNLPFTTFMNDEAEGNDASATGSGFLCNFTCFMSGSGTANLGSTIGLTTGSGAAIYMTNNTGIGSVVIGNSSAKNFIFDSTLSAVTSGSLNLPGSIIKNVNAGSISQFSWSTGSGVGGPFQVVNSGGNVALHIDDTGGVGIGTATPASGTKFDVRALEAVNGIVSNGTTFTIASGCGTPGSLTGGATAGSFTAGQTACAPVITLPTAPHGWICHVKDLTTPADTFTQSATSVTSCTSSATVTNGDTILFDAIGY